MTTIQFTDADELIDICYDNVFKAVFTRNSPESRGALSDLISALIGQRVTVESITANEPPVGSLIERQIRFDIACKTADGRFINVEMSLNPDRFEPLRLEYYVGKLFTEQELRGAKLNYDDLKEAYQITVLAKNRFFDDEVFLHTFEYYDPEHNTALNGKTRIITVELSKVDKVADKSAVEMGDGEKWAVYFRYLTDKGKRGKINEILKHEEGIAMASTVLVNISRDEVERARLMSEYKYQMDLQSKLVTAERDGIQIGLQQGLQEGLQQGIQQGIQKKALEVAKSMKAGGIPASQISLFTGLTEQQIQEL